MRDTVSGDTIASDASQTLDAAQVVRSLAAFRTPSWVRSWTELAITGGPFLAVLAVTLFAVSEGYYIALALTPVAKLPNTPPKNSLLVNPNMAAIMPDSWPRTIRIRPQINEYCIRMHYN